MSTDEAPGPVTCCCYRLGWADRNMRCKDCLDHRHEVCRYGAQHELREFDPDWCLHPGGTIREAITGRRWTQRHVAVTTGVSEKHLSQIVHGTANYSPAWAVRFAAMLGCSPAFVWNLQSNYLLGLAQGKKDVTRDV